jgi:hypothetical protein
MFWMPRKDADVFFIKNESVRKFSITSPNKELWLTDIGFDQKKAEELKISYA